MTFIVRFISTLFIVGIYFYHMAQAQLSDELESFCKEKEKQFQHISTERREKLSQIASVIREMRQRGEPVRLIFICTHNSRRSQIAQVWAKVASAYYGWKDGDLQVFSGGTEATACPPQTIAALKRSYILIEPINQISAPITVANNPRYQVRLGQGYEPLFLFSKKYDDDQNPSQGFIAVMVCSQADEACPSVRGATKRFSLPYEDPKKADNSPQEQQAYDLAVHTIATEMLYLFSLIR